MQALLGGIVFGMLLIAIPVALVTVPLAVAADTVANDSDTTRLYCGINVECAN